MDPSAHSHLAVVLFTDVVGSMELKRRLGTTAYLALLARHDALFRQTPASFPQARILKDTGDGFFALFPMPSDAVRAALRFQHALHVEP